TSCKVPGEQGSSGLTGGSVVGLKSPVDEDLRKSHSLTGKDAEHLVLRRKEILFRVGWRPQPVLVGNHHHCKVGLPGYGREGPNHPRHELQFFEAVNLLVSRLLQDSAVPVNKQYFLHTWFTLQCFLIRLEACCFHLPCRW